MGMKFRGIVVPADNARIRRAFDAIRPLAPMWLVEISPNILGVAFPYVTPSQDEFDRLGRLFSQTAGHAAFYWRHSANGDGYTLYENGEVVERHYDESGPLGALPFRGVTCSELERAFGRRPSVAARNNPSLIALVEDLGVSQFQPGKEGRKHALLNKARAYCRLLEHGCDEARLKELGEDLIHSAREWLCQPPAVLAATVLSLLDASPCRGEEAC